MTTTAQPTTFSRITFAGEDLHLLADRAIWWPRTATLILADLHWGKDAAFRAHGLPLPDGILDADLQRLRKLSSRLRPGRILILGDLIHARASLTAEVMESVTAWRSTEAAACLLVEGNHDRHAPTLPEDWKIERVGPAFSDGPLHFVHDPAHAPDAPCLAGHLHPSVNFRRGLRPWRLPCFQFGPSLGILPAFSEFTGAGRLHPLPTQRIFPIMGGFCFEWESLPATVS